MFVLVMLLFSAFGGACGEAIATLARTNRTLRGPLGASSANLSVAQRLKQHAALRPSFTAILWGCSMPLWPRILQHIQSKVDGDVSVAKMQLPAKIIPFIEAICALVLRPHSAHPPPLFLRQR